MNTIIRAHDEPAGELSGPDVADVIGASLARPIERLRSLLQEARATHAWLESRQTALEDAVDEAHRIAWQSQQLARLAGGRLRQSHETLSLHAIVLDLLVQRQAAFKRQGIVIRQHLAPVEVIVDPGLLLSLLDALFDWGAQLGAQLWVKLEMRKWPAHAILTLRIPSGPALQSDDERRDLDNLAWHLVAQTALSMGVGVKREATPLHVQAVLEFPRTTRELAGLTALDAERDAGPDSSRIDSQISHLLGMQVLLVTDDRAVEREVASVCAKMGLKLEVTPNAAQGIELSELSKPGLIIIDESLRDDAFDDHLERLLRERPHFHCVEVTTRDTGFEISSWEASGMSRIGRDAIRDQLKTVLAIEFSH